jgi:hypothetical protein
LQERLGPAGLDQLSTDAVRLGQVQYVLSRDWAHTQVELQCKEVKAQAAIVVQAVYRASDAKRSYTAQHKAACELTLLIRGVLARLEYYPRKFAKLEVLSRSSLTSHIRATDARAAYYRHRMDFFHDINVHAAQKLIQATVYRQWYYEKKAVHAACSPAPAIPLICHLDVVSP